MIIIEGERAEGHGECYDSKTKTYFISPVALQSRVRYRKQKKNGARVARITQQRITTTITVVVSRETGDDEDDDDEDGRRRTNRSGVRPPLLLVTRVL